jgi:hypothetical protein
MGKLARWRLALFVATSALAAVLAAFAGCSNSGNASPCSGGSCPAVDAGPDDACPTARPVPLTECALDPVVTCSYGTVCQGGTAYYCSGYHWFAQAQVCGPPGPACPTTAPAQASSCAGYPYGFTCQYGALCADGGAIVASCTNGQWSVPGDSCIGQQAFVSSPLCGITARASVCDPDQADAGLACLPVAPPPDAGGFEAGKDGALDAEAGPAIDGGAAEPACRVVPTPNGGASPVCTPSGSGTDGATCATAADCAPGFECVGDPGHGVCRHYCCDNLCPPGSATDGGGPLPFCDIEPMSGHPGNAVPVCMQEPACTLFQPCPVSPNGANPTQTCTIVDDVTGTTACVVPGPQTVGDSCEEAHCKAGLLCFGLFPSRTCAQLCDASNPCPSGTTCQTNLQNFPSDPSAGICVP